MGREVVPAGGKAPPMQATSRSETTCVRCTWAIAESLPIAVDLLVERNGPSLPEAVWDPAPLELDFVTLSALVP